ncbi:MAG: sulfatase-like hydrolase/transferase [Akkermansia sp.]|nr:sulfatase-like hydrolase/transferase [Akkermansia sp.]
MKAWLQSYCGYFTVVLFLPLLLAVGALCSRQSAFSFSWELPLALLLLFGISAGWCYYKRRAPLPSVRSLWLLTVLAIVYDCCCNIGAFNAPGQLPISIFLTAGVLCLLWALLRYAALLLWLPFLFFQIVQFASYNQYGTRINSLVLAETLEASADELAAYLTGNNLLYLTAAIIGLGLLSFAQVRILRGVRERMPLINVGLLYCFISVMLGAFVPSNHRSGDYYWPVVAGAELGQAAYEAVCHNQATVELVEQLESPTQQPSSINTLKGGEGVVLIVHVGESVRADRMSLNGYEKDTTPWLRQQKQVISFTDCISAAYDTCQAQIAILTDARRDIHETAPEMLARTGSVLDLFRANGFDIYSFFGRRAGQKLKYDRVIRLLTQCSKARFNAPGSPWTAIPQMADVLRNTQKGDNLVFFINNEGSHTPFYHYDRKNPPFTPSVHTFENPSSLALEVNNAYDNTVHYTDEYVRRVCHLLQGRPFIYIYVSDHGEYLGHDGIWGRAALGENELSYHETDGSRVGMFILTSPDFESVHPHFTQAVSQLRSHAAMKVGHEHIFHTLLGLFDIQTPYYNPALDLCSSQAEPYTGPSPAPVAPAPPSGEL